MEIFLLKTSLDLILAKQAILVIHLSMWNSYTIIFLFKLIWVIIHHAIVRSDVMFFFYFFVVFHSSLGVNDNILDVVYFLCTWAAPSLNDAY